MNFKTLILSFLLIFGISNIVAKNHALLIGIGNYKTDWSKIHGNNDVDLLSGKLKAKGFTVSTLKDTQATKKNVVAALSNLVSKAKAGDIIYLHFSGHGQLVQDMNNDEPDKRDQSFVCYDAGKFAKNNYKGQNHLIDDELFPYINKLKSAVGPKGLVVIAFDSCYSGNADRSIEDEPEPDEEIEYVNTTRGAVNVLMANDVSKSYLSSIKKPGQYAKNGGKLVVISACSRKSKNYEIKVKNTGKQYGSLSYCISKLLDKNVPINQWDNFFKNKKYAAYKIFDSKQQPVVETY